MDKKELLPSLLKRRAYEAELAKVKRRFPPRQTQHPQSEKTAKKRPFLEQGIDSEGAARAIALVSKLREDDAAAAGEELAQSKKPEEDFLKIVNLSMPEENVWKLLGSFSMLYFAKTFLPHYYTHEFSTAYHADYFKLLHYVAWHKTKTPALVIGFREIGKSVSGALLMPLQVICCPQYALKNGEVIDISKKYIMYLSASTAMAQKQFFPIQAELESNQKLHKAFGNLYAGENGTRPKSLQWSKTRAETMEGHYIEAVGRWTKLRGTHHKEHRVGLIVGDDLEDDEQVRSIAARTGDFNWITRKVLPMLSSDNGNALILGTRLKRTSMLSMLAEFGRVNNWRIKRYPLFKMTEEGKRVYTWPERFGEEFYQTLRRTLPESAIEQEYLDKPADGHRDLTMDDITFYQMGEVEHLLREERLVIAVGVDPACKKTEQSDYTAIVVVGMDLKTGARYVLPSLIERLTLAEKVKSIVQISERWNANRVGIEAVQFQAALKEAVDNYAKLRRATIPTVPINQKVEKTLRISRLFPPIKNGTIRFLANNAANLIIVDQLLNLYDTDHDDGADAFEIANRLLDDMGKIVRAKASASVYTA